MKRIHYPTLFMHGVLLVMIRLLSYHYPDGFLVSAGLLLLCHVIWSCMSRRSLLLSHLVGCAMELMIFPTGLLSTANAPDSPGTGLALLFYFAGLSLSLLLEAIIVIVRHFLHKS